MNIFQTLLPPGKAQSHRGTAGTCSLQGEGTGPTAALQPVKPAEISTKQGPTRSYFTSLAPLSETLTL